MEAINFLARRIMLQNKLPEPVYLRRLGSTPAQGGSLMTQTDAMLVFKIAGPGRYRFKIIDHQIIFAHRTGFYFFNETTKFGMNEGFPEVYTARLAEDEA